MFEAGFNSLLANSPAIAAELGGSPFARADGASGVFPEQLPEASTLPACVYNVVGYQNVKSNEGTNRLVKKRVQVDCYGRHYGDAKFLQDAIRETVLSFKGTLSDGTLVCQAWLNSELDAFEDAPFLFCAVLDFDVWIINQA